MKIDCTKVRYEMQTAPRKMMYEIELEDKEHFRLLEEAIKQIKPGKRLITIEPLF